MQWRMLQQEEPKDYVIATGRQVSVRRFIEMAVRTLGWKEIIWEGKGINEVGIRSDTGEVVVKVDPSYFRPTEVETLLGDASLAEKLLNWKSSTSLEELVEEMIISDMKSLG